MRRAALIALLAAALAGVAVVAIAGASRERTLAFTLGAPSSAPAVVLRPGDTVCQAPIAVAAGFDGVELQPGTFGAAGSPLALVVRRLPGGQPLARGRLAAGYADVKRETIHVGAVPAGGEVAVCVTNAGSRRTALYGTGDAAARTSSALLDGRPTGMDLDLVFRTGARSTLALVPDMLARMALFRGGWVGTWLYWLLLAAILLAVPALLARALAGALRDEVDEREPPRP
jgi:hypothetical protein